MKFTWSRQIGRLQGRIKKYVKKSRDLRRGLLTLLAIWLVIPVLTVKAADNSSTPAPSETVVNTTLSQELSLVTPTFSVEVGPSPHSDAVAAQAAAVAAAKATAAKAIAQSTAPADPGYAAKMEWAQKAAAAYGINWKLLAAVWSVETGQTWYTSRGSSAGARGPCQFMPGTWRAYAQDGNGDGTKNLYDARDCLFGSAHLLASNGAREGNIDGALLHYNHSLAYVAKVKRIMASIEG